MCLEYPIGTDFGQPAVQLELKGLIEKTLRASAKAYLPQRIKRLAEQRGFVYTSVSITAAKPAGEAVRAGKQFLCLIT